MEKKGRTGHNLVTDWAVGQEDTSEDTRIRITAGFRWAAGEGCGHPLVGTKRSTNKSGGS